MIPLVTNNQVHTIGPLFSSLVEDNFSTLSHVRGGEISAYLSRRKNYSETENDQQQCNHFFGGLGLSKTRVFITECTQ